MSLEIPAGLIELEASPTDETVVEIDGERDPDDLVVRLEPRGAGHRLRIEHRGRRFGRFGSRGFHVAARVPERVEIDASTGSADLVVRGPVASIAVRSGSGDLSFERTTGNVTVKVASGDVLGHSVGGDLTMHGASGDVSVSEVAGGVTVRTASGDVGVGRVAGSVRVSTVSGEVRVGSVSSGAVEIRAVSGDVELGVEPGSRVLLDLATASGDATSDLPMADADGGGAADLELHVGTVSGDITVRRAAHSPIAGA